MWAMRAKLLYMLLYLCTLPTWGVEIFSRKLNSSTGLPDNNVRYLLQDSCGFIWMGTPGGLYRYDGYFFKTYKHTEANNTRLLNNNHINGLYDTGDGRIVVSQQGGQLAVYDVRHSQFVDMSQPKKTDLYNRCRRLKVEDRLIIPYRSIIENGGSVINDNLGNVVIIDNTGFIWHIDRKTGETSKIRVFDEALFPLISSKKYKVMTSEKNGLIWVSTNGCGITVYDRREHSEQHIRQQSGIISTDYIVDMCMDRDDNIWVADEFHGVVYLTTAQNNSEVRLLNPQAKGLRGNQTYIMYRLADSTILVANTQGDVYKADDNLNLQPTPVYQRLDVHAICQDKVGQVWVGTRQRGLMSGDRQWYEHEKNNVSSVSADNINYLLSDSKGRVWIACEDSHLDLAIRQPNGKYAFRHFFDRKFSARVMYQDRRGIIWVGTKNGLFCFNPDQLQHDTTAYKHPLTGAELNYSDVSCIFEDSRGVLWVGTLGSGVYSADNRPGKVQGLFARQTAVGLISHEVQAIVEDRGGNMWFATKNGLTKFNPKDKKVRQYYDESNLMRNYYAENCAHLLKNGRLAFGTNSGIVIYSSESTPTPTLSRPRLSITDVLVNGSEKDFQEKLQLNYNENSLIVRFSAFNYRDVAATRYSYMLEGYDKDWSEPSGYSFAQYLRLPPGRYVLHVKVYGAGQPDKEQTLDIVIRHPWWATWWAYLVYFIVVITVGYVVYRQLRTIYDLRRRISIEKELTEYKLMFFTNISHEFRTPLTIIRGAIDRIRSIKEIPADLRQPVSNMGRSTDRMLRLINQLLEFRKMQAGKLSLSLEDIDIIGFVRNIYQNFSDLAENKQISYSFTSNVKAYEIPIDRQHIDKVVYNLLSNAFKYTPTKGNINVSVRVDEGHVTISVQDTGVGIPKEKQPELFQRFMQSTFASDSIGIGLHLTKALVEVHHGSIHFEENKPQGSVFVVELPAERSVYKDSDFLKKSELKPVATNQSSPVYRELAGEPMNDRTILVVEDDSDIVTMLKQTLGRFFHVSVAMDGAAALDMLNQEDKPDLIVSDVLMPVMDGYELTRRVRSNPATQTIPIVLLTALTNEEKRLKGIEHGADAYLTKPFETKLLISTCRQIIGQRDLLRRQAVDNLEVTTIAPPEIIVEERDKHLLNMMNAWLYDHISDPMLSVDQVAEAMGYRRSIFFKKVKALTGQTPADYIKTLRMNRAAELLRSETITVAEVCYQVGISDPHYFTKVFKQKFGISPKRYQQGKYTG